MGAGAGKVAGVKYLERRVGAVGKRERGGGRWKRKEKGGREGEMILNGSKTPNR